MKDGLYRMLTQYLNNNKTLFIIFDSAKEIILKVF